MNPTPQTTKVAVARRATGALTFAIAATAAIRWPGQLVVRVAQRSGATGGHRQSCAKLHFAEFPETGAALTNPFPFSL